jgi:predicted RND superfamily exporter protein
MWGAMAEFLIKNILRNRVPLSIVLVIFTLIFGYFLTKIHVDNDTYKAIPKSLKEKIEYDKLKEEFSASISVLCLFELSSGSLTQKVDSIRAWGERYRNLKYVANISNISTLQVPVKGGFLGINSVPVVPKENTEGDTILRKRIRANREFTQLLVSDDETVFGMVISLTDTVDRSVFFKDMTILTDSINRFGNAKAYFTSEAAVSYFTDISMKHDFRILLPICFLLISLLLYWIFRRVLFVIAALLVNVFALVWTFGLMGLTNTPFSVVTSIIPIILFPIGVADAIHIIKTYISLYKENGGNAEQALIITYKEQLVPCLLTSLTTFFGFSSFAFSPILWTSIFGIYTGIAVLFAYIFNVLLIPIFMSIEHGNSKSFSAENPPEEKLFGLLWNFIDHFSLKTSRWLILIPVLLVFFVIGFKMVHVESNPITMLPEANLLRKSDKFIEKHFGGTRFFSAVLRRKGETINTVEDWATINRISSHIESVHGVGNVTSLLPLLTRVSRMLSGGDISKPAVSMLTSSNSIFGKGYSGFLKTFLSKDHQEVRIGITCKNDPDIKPIVIARNIERFVNDSCAGWEVVVSGQAVLTEAMSLVLIKTQISSLLTTFLPVILCLIIFFRSLRTGVFAVIPIITATAFVYASMGVLGVTINLVTVIIMNTCVGIGIDYSIHFVSGYIYNRKNNTKRLEALNETIRNKGTPILLNTFIVGIGFLVLAFSGFPPVRDFGILVFISMMVSAFFSLLMLPILIRYFGIGSSIDGKGKSV